MTLSDFGTPARHRLRETASLLWLFVNPIKTRPHAIYDILSTHNNLGDSSLYLNLGYWKDATTYDDACAALARLVGERAGLGPDDDVLDAGFGFGDQDILWTESFHPRKITGINITESQVAFAKGRVAARGLDGQIELLHGSATAMPFGANRFSKLVSVEAAFHFVTREAFFREAYRVLRPGGTIVIADAIPRLSVPKSGKVRRWLRDFAGRSVWQYPKENLYAHDVFSQKMREVGFVDVTVEDLSEHVFAPFKRYARLRVHDPAIQAKINPVIRAMWGSGRDRYDDSRRELDYVVVKATKPLGDVQA